ncbi:MAG: phospho-N-acetylmuramoyl-pentapeptide-transferase [Alphaproteobacteria bacterium]|nr:phospho-N-acetylmuramoyl-pentapeptide-transferase [Alphaproteobacteria bacterium]
MIYYFFESHVNLFRYITFRSGCAVLTALLISFLITPYFIRFLKGINPLGQPIREDGPSSHLKDKKGVPTMGGLVILISIIISTLLWANLSNPYIWIILFVLASMGVLGFMDDYVKVTRSTSKGVPGKIKLLIQSLISIVTCFAVQKYASPDFSSHITLPLLKNVVLDLGFFYIVFVILVIVGSSNAVNLTDGLDGLVIVPVMIVALCFAIICYLVGNYLFAAYLQIHYVAGVGEVAVLCSAMLGAGLSFLWFNVNPAKIFMGDTGSLSLGGALGAIAIIVKHEIVLAIIGGLFVVEALSVMLQVYYYKFTGGKRMFLMAPIHHHFEKKGWTESQIVVRFWIIAIIFALIGMSTLKLR